jgi:hypothetical protein
MRRRPAAGRTRGEERTAAREEPLLDAVDEMDETRRHLRARIEQPAAIGGEAAPPVGEMRLSGHAHARGALIEPRQQRHQPVERAFVDAFRSDGVIEHAALVQPAHHDQPVDHGPASGERQVMPHRLNGITST